MTTDELKALWEKCEDTRWNSTERPEPDLKFNKRRDLNAFLLLDSLVKGTNQDIVSCAEHDEIWLCIDLDELAAVITEEQVMELVRCGVYIDTDADSLHLMR